ncbi:TRAP transporter large permease [Sporosarcina cascadiensis]|uniref:TRAP transporter large permease n=1 Tax=Sporosarcina cascadiensis TaxID=2660747 RepID=UPI00129B5AFE|nr:TRAP transporter large permease subunit [Sporosarcina cascadiensis]
MEAILLLGTMLLLLAFGVPIAFVIGLSSITFLLITDMSPLILISQRTVLGIDSFPLLAIPLFIFAGYLMETGGLSKRLVLCIEKILGGVPGGVGTVTIICCAIFAALTGSGPATVAAIGAIMLPSLLNNGYSKAQASGILASAGALGPVIPPSIAMIVYGSTMNTSIPEMFIAAIIPGVLLTVSFIVVNLLVNRNIKTQIQTVGSSSPRDIFISIRNAFPVLLLPLIVLGGIYKGIFTPTEAAVVAVVYSLLLSIVYKEFKFHNLIDSMKKTTVTSGMVMFIMAMSANFGWILSAAKIPTSIADSLLPFLGNKYIYIILLLVILFIAGCFMEVLALIVILGPILIPIGVQLGMDPLHLGVTFCIALVTGLITPPFGINLFTTAAVAKTSFTEVVKGVFPYMIAAFVTIVILAFVPWFTLWLPSLMPQ